VAVPPAGDPLRPWLARYPSRVPPHLDYPPKLLTELVDDTVRRWGSRTALVHHGARWTYSRFWAESERFAVALEREGVRPGDRVAIYMPNCPGFAIAFFGVLRLGAIAVQVSPLYVGEDLVRVLNDAEPKALVTLEILHPNVKKVEGEAPVPVEFVARLREFYSPLQRPFVNLVLRRRGLPTRFPTGPKVRSWRRAVRTAGTVPIRSGDPATTVAVFQYTGGTTGTPKAAMLTHRNLVANVLQTNTWNTTRIPGKEVILASIPFFHIYGLTVGLLMGLADGATIVMQTRPEVDELLGLIDRYRPSQFPGVPALYQALVQRPDLARHDIRSIRFCLSGSAPLPPEVQRKLEAATGGRILEGYGLTEASPVTHANPTEGERRAGSIGLPLPDTDQKILDPTDPDRALPAGEVGELAVHGPQVMLGYYRQPEETAGVLRDGWLSTGDLARIDSDGYAYIVDRKKDMVNVGGLKVYPREVEDVLFEHPAVADAAVVGVPDLALGEVPKAFVVLKAGTSVGEAELVAFVRSRIAHYKVPRTIEFRESLPRSGIQKVLRRALRAGEASPAVAPSPPDRHP